MCSWAVSPASLPSSLRLLRLSSCHVASTLARTAVENFSSPSTSPSPLSKNVAKACQVHLGSSFLTKFWRKTASSLRSCTSRRLKSSAAMAMTSQDKGFFSDASDAISNNVSALHYGVCATDVDGDGKLEFFVCGFGTENQVLKWDGSKLVNIAHGTPLGDKDRRAIGVAAGDIDGDGLEEIYVLNTDTFGGRKKLTDRLFDKQGEGWVDLFSLPQNMDEVNLFAGRSVCAVDRKGSGRYGFFVANYGGQMKLFELLESNFIADRAKEAGLVTYPTGGRGLISLPLVSHTAMDIFAGNENGPNFLFVNKGDGSGQYVESAAAYGVMDSDQNCRGIAVADVEGNGELGLVCGNWEGPHRLFAKSGPGPLGGASSLGFLDVSAESGGFRDMAPKEMASPSRIRTVISADFDNDGFEELFFNNIGQPNRLFRQEGAGKWVEIDIGDALEPMGLGTGASVADIDGDGRLELLIAHGESGPQPLSFFRPPANDNAWIRIQPLTKQGAPARGASVKVCDDSGRWQKRVIDAGSGYLCSMEPVAHFGLGDRKGPVKVRLSWPDGSITDLENVLPNQMHVISHPSTVPISANV